MVTFNELVKNKMLEKLPISMQKTFFLQTVMGCWVSFTCHKS